MISEYKTHRFENLNKLNFPGVGRYGIPQIAPESCPVCDWIPFNHAANRSADLRQTTGIHFFVDDYQFERVWGCPDAYLKMLPQFAVACSPDFSLYTDMPFALQLNNHFRKHWVAAYWQLHGVQVIPSVSWSDRDSFAWCFDGEPTQSPVAVSSVGSLKTAASRAAFVAGYDEMLARLQPTEVLFYGTVPPECAALVPIRPLPQFAEKFARGRA